MGRQALWLACEIRPRMCVFSAQVLSTCELDCRQSADTGLDCITGFQLVDCKERIFVLEVPARPGLPPHILQQQQVAAAAAAAATAAAAEAAAAAAAVAAAAATPVGTPAAGAARAKGAVAKGAPAAGTSAGPGGAGAPKAAQQESPQPPAAAAPRRRLLASPTAAGRAAGAKHTTRPPAGAAAAAARASSSGVAEQQQAGQQQQQQHQVPAASTWRSGLEVLQEIALWALESPAPCADARWRPRHVLLNPERRHPSRLYAGLGAGAWVVKLRAPLREVGAAASSYASGRVRPGCVAGLERLFALREARWARSADAMALWPSEEEVHLLDKKFGGGWVGGWVGGWMEAAAAQLLGPSHGRNRCTRPQSRAPATQPAPPACMHTAECSLPHLLRLGAHPTHPHPVRCIAAHKTKGS